MFANMGGFSIRWNLRKQETRPKQIDVGTQTVSEIIKLRQQENFIEDMSTSIGQICEASYLPITALRIGPGNQE